MTWPLPAVPPVTVGVPVGVAAGDIVPGAVALGAADATAEVPADAVDEGVAFMPAVSNGDPVEFVTAGGPLQRAAGRA